MNWIKTGTVVTVLLLCAGLVVAANPSTARVQQSQQTTLHFPGKLMGPAKFIQPADSVSPTISGVRGAPANDLCENAVFVAAPGGTYQGTCEGATLDCPGNLDWNAVWYMVELPYANNDLFVQICDTTGDVYSAGVVYLPACDACDQYVIANSYGWITCQSGTQGLDLVYQQIAGPATVAYPVHWDDEPGNGLPFEVTFEVVEHQDCVVDCEPNEGEPVCYDDYDDVFNAGCNSDPPTFQDIACGETICGTSGVFAFGTSNYRDMDWYHLTVEGSSIITWSGIAEFPVAMWIFPYGCPAGSYILFGNAAECQQVTLTTECLPAGEYMVVIAPADWGAYPCGLKWEATLSCEPCEFYGACCFGDPIECQDLTQEECDLLSGTWYAEELCSEGFVCPGSCPDAEITIEIFTDDYPGETTWELQRHGTGEVLCSGGPLEAEQTLHTSTCCVDSTGCYDFVIYDAWGDGICCSYGEGYYNVYYNFELVGTGGEFDSEEWVTYIGEGCVLPTGRCCYEPWPNCVDEILEADCYAIYDGDWTEGLNCIDDPCPEPGTADFEVTAPYTSETRTTCGAGDDCSPENQSYDTEDHTYLVHIPNDGTWSFNTCLLTGFDTWMAVGTTLCGSEVGWNDDACSVQSEVVAYVTAGDYYVDVEGYNTCGEYILDIHEIVPCILDCPWWAVLEQEACGDDTNGGCNMDVPAFEPLVCGETLCGTIWADGGTRDTDWFEYRATADDTMTWTVEAEFDVVIGLVETNTPGSGDCADTTGYLNPYITGADCTPVSIEVPVVTNGVYWFFVSHQDYYDYPCDTFNDYIAKLTGLNCACGDLDYDGLVGTADYQCFLAAFGSCDDGDPETPDVAPFRADADLDGDGCITLVDYQMWISCYRDANKRNPVGKEKSSGRGSVVAP